MQGDVKKVVLAYSGGLDTSVILRDTILFLRGARRRTLEQLAERT